MIKTALLNYFVKNSKNFLTYIGPRKYPRKRKVCIGKSIDESVVEFSGLVIEPDFQTTMNHME
jgi:hypothetical protein